MSTLKLFAHVLLHTPSGKVHRWVLAADPLRMNSWEKRECEVVPVLVHWCETMERWAYSCGCPDCGPSRIDLGPGLRNTPP